MPKSLDKTKGSSRKRKTAANSSNNKAESDAGETKSDLKKKRLQTKGSLLEGIEMSRELAAKVKQKKTTRSSRSTKNTEPRVCGNGRPMPSLAELEAMYKDSDDDEPLTKPTEPIPEERCVTPEVKLDVKDEDLNSPTALMKIASKAAEILSKTLENKDDGPPPPVIPPRKRKKPVEPYIVGCKERDQVPWAPKTKWCVGIEDYGVDSQGSDEDDCPTKRKKRGTKLNLSKSIFNAKSDEIAEKLKEAEADEPVRGGSPDSNDTVEYDFPNISPINKSTLKAFSPLPSTSKDCETIMKNDKLFNESLQGESLSNDSQNDVEVVEVPCETIIIDDSVSITNTKIEKTWDFEDDCCIILDPEVKSDRKSNFSKDISPKHDAYSSIDLTETFDDEVYVIGDDDIESVIAENQAILGKDRKKNNIDTVTAVDSSVIFVSETSRPELNVHRDENGVSEPANVDHRTNSYNSRPEGTEQNTAIIIEEVVNNFFNQPQHTPCTPRPDVSTIDLSTCQERFRNRFSSFLSSVENLFRGYTNSRTNLNPNHDVVVVEESNSSVANQSTQPSNTEITPVNTNAAMPPMNADSRLNSNHTNTKSNAPTQIQNQISPVEDVQPRSSGRSLGDCPICMDSLDNNPVASTLCGHVFCMNCIKASIKTNKKCPTCRKTLKGTGYHQLFI